MFTIIFFLCLLIKTYIYIRSVYNNVQYVITVSMLYDLQFVKIPHIDLCIIFGKQILFI